MLVVRTTPWCPSSMCKCSRMPVVAQVHGMPFPWADETCPWPAHSCQAVVCLFLLTHFFLVENNSLVKRSLSHKLLQNLCIYAWVSLCVCSVLVLLQTHCLPLMLLGWRDLGLLLSAVVMFSLLGPSHCSWDLLFTPTPSFFPKWNPTILAFLVTSTY